MFKLPFFFPFFQGLLPCKGSFWWSYPRAWQPQWGFVQR